jgi:proteic killer suppression protein
VIRSFKNKATETVFNGEYAKKINTEIQQRAREKLKYIDAAVSLRDLEVPPGNRLESLKGNRAGQHSIRINEQWRICFRWKDKDAFDVEIVDYH